MEKKKIIGYALIIIGIIILIYGRTYTDNSYSPEDYQKETELALDCKGIIDNGTLCPQLCGDAGDSSCNVMRDYNYRFLLFIIVGGIAIIIGGIVIKSKNKKEKNKK